MCLTKTVLLFQQSRNSQHFMEPSGSLSCLKQPVSDSCNEPMNPALTLLPHFSGSLQLLFSHLPFHLFASGFPTKPLYIFLFFPINTTYPSHFILLDFNNLIMPNKVYTSSSSSFCNFLQILVTLSFIYLFPQIHTGLHVHWIWKVVITIQSV